jgi:hypothetical protein
MAAPTTNRICYALSNPYMLDECTRSQIATSYSTRRLKSNVSKVMRIHRSSDNAETDIGAIGENLDEAAILTFVGTDSAYVAKWYDQTGNGNDAVQTTVANMPRIVNAGIIDRDFDTSKCADLWPTFASAAGVTMIDNGLPTVLTGWTGALWTNAAVSNNELTFNATAQYGRTNKATTISNVLGKRYFISCDVKATSNLVNVKLTDDSAGAVIVGYHSGSGNYETIRRVVTCITSNVCKLQIRDDRASGWDTISVKNLYCIDITAYGKPALYFDGTNDVLTIANSASVDILGAPLMLNAVFNATGTSWGWLISKNIYDSTNTQFGLIYEVNPTKRLDFWLKGSKRLASPNILQATQYAITEGREWNGDMFCALNGAYAVTGNFADSLTSRPNMRIGAMSGNSDGTGHVDFFKGYISEIIIATDTTKRTKIEASQMKYFQPK